MREIKFRAFDKDRKEIYYIDDFYWFEEEGVHDSEGNGHHANYILMQYTGLKDKNGIEIYEGDIVEAINRNHESWVSIREVKYLNGCYMFGSWNAHEYFNKHTKIRVIGNIYENLEIMKQSE